MNENLLRYKNDLVYSVFDFEGENLNLHTSKPWQFACVTRTQKKILERHDIFIKWPDLNISKDAERITRFDRARWEREGVPPKEAFKTMNGVFEKSDYVGGHNLFGYDIDIYRSMCRVLGIEPLPIHYKTLDTQCLVKSLPEKLDIPFKEGDDLFEWQMKLSNKIVRKVGYATLGASCKIFEVDYDKNKAHDALYDVDVNAQVLMKAIWKIAI